MGEISPARAGTVVVLAALVPVIVGGVAGQPKAAEVPKAAAAAKAAEAKAAEAKVTVDMAAGSVFGDGGQGAVRHLQLTAAGPPPTGRVQLVDGHGRNVTTVTPVDSTNCKGATSRSTGLTEDGMATPWCLEVAGLRAGSEATGVLETAKSKVTLTAALRHRRLLGPLLAALLGFAAGIGALYVVPLVLGISRRSEVDSLLDENENRPPPQCIAHLREWVKRQKELKAQDDAALLPIVQRVMRYGPDLARSARQELRLALVATTVPVDQPVRQAAALQANRNDHDIKDFFDDERLHPDHPAGKAKVALEKTQTLQAEIDYAAGRIQRIEPSAPAALVRELDAVRAFFSRAREDQLDDLKGEIDKLQLAVDREPGAAGRSKAAGAGPAAPDVEAWALPTLSRREAEVLRAGVIVIGGLLALVALNYSVYVPATTFGTAGDYYKLAAAAAGSGAVASIAPLLQWRSATSAPEG